MRGSLHPLIVALAYGFSVSQSTDPAVFSNEVSVKRKMAIQRMRMRRRLKAVRAGWQWIFSSGDTVNQAIAELGHPGVTADFESALNLEHGAPNQTPNHDSTTSCTGYGWKWIAN